MELEDLLDEVQKAGGGLSGAEPAMRWPIEIWAKVTGKPVLIATEGYISVVDGKIQIHIARAGVVPGSRES